MIQGTQKYLSRLRNYPKRIEAEVSRLLFNLAKQLVDKAQETRDTGVNTTAQDNSYVCAVYYNGKLVQGPYIPQGTTEVGTMLDGSPYPNMGDTGRRWAMQWAESGFLSSGRAKMSGYEVMIANCAWYTVTLEEGTYRTDGKTGRQWHVINQVFDQVFEQRVFDRAADILKKSGINLRTYAYQIRAI